MKAESGRRPVLATMCATQIPAVGPVPAVLGLAAGAAAALQLALDHGPDSEVAFETALTAVRSDPALDYDYSSAYARGIALISAALATISGSTR